MPKILFLAPHRPGRSPAQRFRFEQFIPVFEKAGWACDISYVISKEDDKVLGEPGHLGSKAGILARAIVTRAKDVLRRKNYDVIYISREALMVNSAFFERALSFLGSQTILDFDDAIWLNAVGEANKTLEWLRGGSKFRRVVQSASVVIAGNEYLADYARAYNGDVRVIPTVLDTDHYYPRAPSKPPGSPVVIGWSGSPSTLPYFDALTPALRRVRDKFGDRVEFKVLGDARYRNVALGIHGIGWSEAAEIREVANMDIGIMPQPDNEWSRGKCGFKALLYMSMGIPAVVSPVGVNSEIITDGVNGLWARDDDEWVSSLSRLILDEDLRARFGETGRQTVVERYSVASQMDRFLEILNYLAQASDATPLVDAPTP